MLQIIPFTLDDEYMYEEKCSYPGKDIVTYNFDRYWTCRGNHTDPGCVTRDQYIWNGVVRGHNGHLNFRDHVTIPHLNILTIGVYTINCEMCYTRQGLEATQITVVNMNCETVCETYIKPDPEIIDYNSEYGDIYASTLEGIEIMLHDVQNDL